MAEAFAKKLPPSQPAQRSQEPDYSQYTNVAAKKSPPSQPQPGLGKTKLTVILKASGLSGGRRRVGEEEDLLLSCFSPLVLTCFVCLCVCLCLCLCVCSLVRFYLSSLPFFPSLHSSSLPLNLILVLQRTSL